MCLSVPEKYKTDFPVLTCAVCRDERGIRVAVGARPQKAMLLTLSETQNADLAQNRADAAAKSQTNLRLRFQRRITCVPVLHIGHILPRC